MKSDLTAQTIIIGEMPAPKRRGFALRESLSSVTAGVGQWLPKQQLAQLPDAVDFASKDAFDKYKEYNTKTNARVREKHMWGDIAEKVASSLLTGATIVIGGAVFSAMGGGFAAGAIALAGLIGVTVGVFYAIRLPATIEQSDKGMDVGDFHTKRNAELTAQAIVKALDEREGKGGQQHTHTQEVIVVKEPANENRSPSTQIAASSAERSIEARISEISDAKSAAL